MSTHVIFRRPLLALACAALAMAIGSCCPEDPFTPSKQNVPQKDAPFLRVMHAADDGPAVRVFLDNLPFFSAPLTYLGFPYGINDGKYYPADTAVKLIRFIDSASGTVLASSPITLERNKYYTTYFYGKAGSYRALITSDDPSTQPSASQCRYRFVHLSPDSPPVTVRQHDPTNPPVVLNLAYGTASNYVNSTAYPPPGGTGIFVSDATGRTLIGLPPPYIFLPGSSVITIVMTARSQPEPDQRFLTLSPLNDNTVNIDKLYGSPPLFTLIFSAVRLVNIVPSGNQGMDLAFRDDKPDFAPNDYFRRNLPGMDVATNVLHLESAQPYHFVMTKLLKDQYPFRIEYNITPFWDPTKRQPVLVGEAPFTLQNSKRYSFVAFGPFDSTRARSTLVSEFSFPALAGKANLRFFNGEYGANSATKLRLRVAGTPSANPIAYTDASVFDPSYLEVNAGVQTIQVIDPGNNVLASKPGVNLQSRKNYLVFLSRGANGAGLRLDLLSSDIVLK